MSIIGFDDIKYWVHRHPRIDYLQFSIRKILPNSSKCKEELLRERDPLTIRVTDYKDRSGKGIVYYIKIGKEYTGVGFCSLLRSTLLYLAYGDLLGFSLYVVWDDNILYSQHNGINNFNEFFKQPIDDEAINSSRFVIMSKTYDIDLIIPEKNYRVSEEEIDILSQMIKKYLRLSEACMDIIHNDSKRLLSGKNILGVHIRGTDFKEEYDHHPILPSFDEFINVIQNHLEKYGYNYIFLATDEKSTIRKLKEVFGEKIIYYTDIFRSDDNNPVHYNTNEDGFKLGVDILKDVYTLSCCNGLIGGLSNVTIIARAMNKAISKEYTSMEIIDDGLYKTLRNGGIAIRKKIRKT